ncbi:hypothetical protein HZC35_02955 [Candidatus Saganbacteria bacterium]|nr:hypothetical protein [Candidatus Saganbacteria bacterium]
MTKKISFTLVAAVLLAIVICGTAISKDNNIKILKAIYLIDIDDDHYQITEKDLITGKKEIIGTLDIKNINYYTHRYSGKEYNIHLIGDSLIYYNPQNQSIIAFNIKLDKSHTLYTITENGYFKTFYITKNIDKIIYSIQYEDKALEKTPFSKTKHYVVDLKTGKKIEVSYDYGYTVGDFIPRDFLDNRYIIFEAHRSNWAKWHVIYDLLSQDEVLDGAVEIINPVDDIFVYSTINENLQAPYERMSPPNNSLRCINIKNNIINIIAENIRYDISNLKMSANMNYIKYDNDIAKNDSDEDRKKYQYIYSVKTKSIWPYNEKIYSKYYPRQRYIVEGNSNDENDMIGSVSIYDSKLKIKYSLEENLGSGYFIGIYSNSE